MLRRLAATCAGIWAAACLCGCAAVIIGAAAGAGTSVWYQGKLSQEVNASYDRTITAARKALVALKLPVQKETRNVDIAQLKSVYTDGKEIWIDVRRISEKTSRVDVRVGAVESDKTAADKILQKVQTYL